MQRNGIETLARIVITVSLPILLVVTPLYLFVSPGFAHFQYARPGFPASFRFQTSERQRISDAVIGYLRGDVSREAMASIRTESGEIALLDREVEHMVDVRRVMDGFFRAHQAATLLALASLGLLAARRQMRSLIRALRRGLIFTAALMGVVLVASTVDFDAFFTVFHQMFFSAGSWLFWEEDTLIQLYPLPFWIGAVAMIAIGILLEAGAVWALTAWLGRRAKHGGEAR